MFTTRTGFVLATGATRVRRETAKPSAQCPFYSQLLERLVNKSTGLAGEVPRIF